MALGAILRAERERRGLTEHQVAEATRMLVQMVREMEAEDFHRIAAPIYGKGFVKLYAELLGIDPVPLIKDFEALYHQRGRKPSPPPRVPLQHFGTTPGAGLERITPPAAPPPELSEEAPTPAPIRVPAPSALRGAQAGGDTSARPTPPTPPADLFGEPLPPSGQISIPRDEPAAAAPLFVQPSERVHSDSRDTADDMAAREAVRRQPRLPSAASAGKPRFRRGVLDSAAHRFDVKPYRSGTLRVVLRHLARLASSVVGGLAFVVLAVESAGRGLGRSSRRATGTAGRGMAQAGRALRELPWARILRVALPALAGLTILGGLVAGVRACTRPAPEVELSPELQSAAIVERVLPPPAAYAD